MITKDLLRQVIYEQRELKEELGVRRQISQTDVDAEEIMVISGIRRCGKSVLMQQIRSQRAERDYALSFDDDRLLHFTVEDFQTLCDVFAEDFGVQHSFYLDEVQLVEGWERFADRLQRHHNKVFITGSNAYLLSRELGTLLTGRHLSHELFPMSMAECMELKGMTWEHKDFYTTEGRARLLNAQTTYLKEGGFPQYLKTGNPRYLRELYSDIIYRDIVARHRLTSDRQLRELTYFLASNVTHRFTYQSAAKAAGIKSAETASDYIGYLENAYLIGILSKYDHKVGQQIKSPKKVYFIDNALVHQIGFSFSENAGSNLENAVYIELRRRGYELFYYSNGAKCDFLIRRGADIIAAYQVTVAMDDPKTRQREISGLKAAMDAFDLREGVIITKDTNEDIALDDGRTIRAVAFFRWVLGN